MTSWPVPATGATLVAIEWGVSRPLVGPDLTCGRCPGGVVSFGKRTALVHETDVLRPVNCLSPTRIGDEHVRAGLGCRQRGWLSCADVLCGEGELALGEALYLLRGVLRERSGALLASVRLTGGGCVALPRGSSCLWADGVRLTASEHGWVASVLHGWVAGGGCLSHSRSPSRLVIRSRSRSLSLGLREV